MRVVRCFSFVDLCGFTTYTDVHGDQKAVAVLAHLRATLRADAEERGVRVTKWLGDGAMLSGIETTEVIACTVAVRDRIDREGTLKLRGGIAAGPVIMFEGDDYIGAAVNAAARLCSVAEPGQVLLGGTAATDLPVGITAVPREPAALPGLSAPVAVCELRSAA